MSAVRALRRFVSASLLTVAVFETVDALARQQRELHQLLAHVRHAVVEGPWLEQVLALLLLQ
jgi:hypothetical protein